MARKALLISDDVEQARSLGSTLSAHGFCVRRQPSSPPLARWVRAYGPEVIIVNVQPNTVSGLDVCRDLRQAGISQPIVAFTSSANDVDHILALENGADDFLEGSISPRLLVARIRAQLRGAEGYSSASSDCLRSGDLIIDFHRGQVLRGQTPLNLSPIEFRLFACLAQHRGRVLTRTQIADHVWGYVGDTNSEQVVNVHICRLRRKVEGHPPSFAVIQTIPGMGYRLA